MGVKNTGKGYTVAYIDREIAIEKRLNSLYERKQKKKRVKKDQFISNMLKIQTGKITITD